MPIEMVVWRWTLSHYKLDHIHWLISCTEQLLQEKKKNPDPSQCPRGKGSCKKKWHSDVMFIKLSFNLNGGLGIEKYKTTFNPLLSSFENSQAHTTLTPKAQKSAPSCSLLHDVSNEGQTFRSV